MGALRLGVRWVGVVFRGGAFLVGYRGHGAPRCARQRRLGGDPLTEWGVPFWQLDLAKARLLLERAVQTHPVTSRYGVPLMLEHGRGLIVEVTDGDDMRYRGNLIYDLAKISVMRLAFGMAEELKGTAVTALALTPGFLRSEAMLEHFGVTEATWRDAVIKDPYFAGSEIPRYIGRRRLSLPILKSRPWLAALSRPGRSRTSTGSRTLTGHARTGSAS